MKLALRLIAVGIVVLASLLYAGAVQIGARNAAISSYLVGQDAVRLVERLDDVSAAVATYYPSGKPDADRDSVQAIGTALGRVDADAQASGLNDGITEPQIARLRRAWSAALTRSPDPQLVRSTNEAMRESYQRVGAIAVMRGSATMADGALAEASLQALRARRGARDGRVWLFHCRRSRR